MPALEWVPSSSFERVVLLVCGEADFLTLSGTSAGVDGAFAGSPSDFLVAIQDAEEEDVRVVSSSFFLSWGRVWWWCVVEGIDSDDPEEGEGARWAVDRCCPFVPRCWRRGKRSKSVVYVLERFRDVG